MKFSCPDPNEVAYKKALKREAKQAKRDAKEQRLMNWHVKFAWLPVNVGYKDCRWLERVMRKGIRRYHPAFGVWWKWEYSPRNVETKYHPNGEL